MVAKAVAFYLPIKTQMNDIHRQRFEHVIDELESRVPRALFAFGVVGKPECGTAGCVAGHAARLYPEQLRTLQCCSVFMDFRENESEDWKSHTWAHAMSLFFGLPRRVMTGLLCPDAQAIAHPDLPVCDDNATAAEVAGMLRTFLRLLDGGKIGLEDLA